MSADVLIHWHEGLFLTPHHLQRMQKGIHGLAASERKLAWDYPYGLIEASLSRDELENHRVRFERLRAVMPSGLEVRLPGNAELPSIDIRQALSESRSGVGISLAVPLWAERRANVLGSEATGQDLSRYLYRIRDVELADENTGGDVKPVQIRLVNARLVLEGDNTDDMEVIPLLRVVRAAGEEVGKPRQDPEFAPPCMVLSASPVLLNMVGGLGEKIEASRKELVVQLTRGGFSIEAVRGVQMEQLMRLRSLGRCSARLPALAKSPATTPFTVYLELAELLADLVALHPDRGDLECPPYNHDDPYVCFQDLCGRIEAYLQGAVAPSFMKAVFEQQAGSVSVSLTEEHLSRPNAYFLAVKTKQDPRAVAQFVEDADKFKLMPKSLERSAVRGIELKEDRHPPIELPAQADLHYFRLDRAGKTAAHRWDLLQKDRSLSLVWDPQQDAFWSDASFVLYMTVPN